MFDSYYNALNVTTWISLQSLILEKGHAIRQYDIPTTSEGYVTQRLVKSWSFFFNNIQNHSGVFSAAE